jgi:hypothetical protein
MPEIERGKSELTSSIYGAEPDKSGNYRTVEPKGFQNAPKSNGKPENCNIYLLNKILTLVAYY